jgi:hypothetical protein
VSFECKYCRKKIATERVYLRHECKEMVRTKEIQTPVGRAAYGLYGHWLECQRRKAPPIETFMTSSYYTAFIKFAQYCRDLQIADSKAYVKLMVSEKLQPNLWQHPDAYRRYLEWCDKRSTPMEQTSVSVDTMLTLSEIFEVPTSDVFPKLAFGEMLELIQQRKLSPWLLFCSRKFKDWLNGHSSTDRHLMMKQIGVDYWSYKLEKHPQEVRDIKQIAEALGI